MSPNTANKPSLRWHEARITRGEQQGRTIGFPTVNLDDPTIMKSYHKGIYAARVLIENTLYCGALFYGPRLVLGETQDVLEIHILNFSQDVYGKKVRFAVLAYIREPANFSSLDDMKIQIQDDCASVQFVCLSDAAE